MSRHKHLATAMAALLVASTLAIAGVAAADEQRLAIDVAQDEDVVIGVTDNDSTVAGATVTVATAEENATYAAAGTYETGGNGTVTLERPAEAVDVAIEASAGNTTGETTATLEAVDDGPTAFGALVSAFVDEQRTDADADGPLGQLVSSFVVENNPGDAPDRAGPPEHAGGPDDGDDDDERDDDGEPADERDDADSDDDDGDGPPPHANAGGD